MRYRQLGRTGLRVSELCLGTMTFGHGFRNIGVLGLDEAKPLVQTALEAGVNFFDTADVYSTGESEEILGTALHETGVPRESVVVATKVRGAMSHGAASGTADVNNIGLSRKHILEACDASLRRLGLDYIDLYQIHGVDPLTPLEETLEALDDLVRRGKVLYIGCSNLPARQIARALSMSEHRGWARFASLQAYYSLVGRDLEHELLPLCREEGLGVLPWSPLSGGYLSGKYCGGRPDVGRRNEFDFPPVAPNASEALVQLEAVAKERGVSMARVALAWLRRQPGVTSVIVGARTVEQLQDDLGAADLDLTDEESERLGEPTKPRVLYPQWMMDLQTGGRRPTS